MNQEEIDTVAGVEGDKAAAGDALLRAARRGDMYQKASYPRKQQHDVRVQPKLSQIDTVDRDIVARVLALRLYRSAPAGQKPGIAMIVCEQQQVGDHVEHRRPPNNDWAGAIADATRAGHVLPRPATPAEFALAAERRPPPDQNQALPSDIVKVAEKLAKDGLFEYITREELAKRRAALLEGWREAFPGVMDAWATTAAREPPQTWVNLFLVPKGKSSPEEETKYRVIVDARASNTLVAESSSYPAFTLEALLQQISNVMASGEWYAVNVDLRHWFHQLPCPRWLSVLFAMRINQKESSVILVPKALPMGFHISPRIGQSSTWALLLGDGEGGLPKYVVHDFRSKVMPGWVPLTDSKGTRTGDEGGIFVILDNIFIFTRDETVARYWSNRIRMRAGFFNIRLKGDDPTRTAPDPTRVITMRLGDEVTMTEFMGIEFYQQKWRTKDKPDATPFSRADGWGLGTHRKLVSLLGECLWSLRVHGRRLLDYPDFMELYQIATPPLGAKWDDSVRLTAAQFETLCEQVEKTRNHETRLALPYWVPRETQAWVCDAAGARADGQVTYVAAMRLDLGTRRMLGAWARPGLPDEEIALRELRAILMCVELGLAADGNVNLFVIASDNQAAIGWVEQMYAQNADARAMLRSLGEMLDSRRLALEYIRSEDNIADVPSRSDPAQVRADGTWMPPKNFFTENKQRMDATLGLLDALAPRAQEGLQNSGKQTRQGARGKEAGARRDRE